MQDKTWTDLYALILALSGNDSFTTAEQTKILANANRRLYQAYRTSDNWPRYLKCVARPGADGTLSREYTATAVNVSSATRSGTTVTIVAASTPNFVEGMYAVIAGLTGSVDPNGTYQIDEMDWDTKTFSYELTTGTGTETYTGSGTVTPSAVADVDTFYRIWSENPVNLNSANEYEFWVDVTGAHVLNNADGIYGWWTSYKAEWDGPYTSAATTIPLEFFYYAAHATYADYLRSDGQVDKALAEEQAAQQYLVVEVDRVENQRNSNIFKRRISTYNSRQSR